MMIVLNLYAFEPMIPGKASEKAIEQLEQVDNIFLPEMTILLTTMALRYPLALNVLMLKANINLKSIL
ncbi:hypothetical protein [Campylobacter concisus]|uniref:hypothetical protein n=1 Tax=Campylobacter concisus TaxID=199 RepID=UPI001F2F6D3D|nr:hypothetical protein [Campylobacter concisus]